MLPLNSEFLSFLRSEKTKGRHLVLISASNENMVAAYAHNLDLFDKAVGSDDHTNLKANAKLLEEIGCFSLVLEKVPAKLATAVSADLHIPTIGIGAGAGCDGQVLVLPDMLGITQAFSPRFLRRYSDIGDQMLGAIQQYVRDVRSVDFPNESEQY